eukprot:gnl/TRDRNA2_/TRDRNA2_157131_c0_seq2.p1 gnl/TRDRNA2_/TRDRNA2_157131_c0~~gnl/TRDRNA2_/TRDRNA2_157131_c0_seq2.p1  ORF type:complete len:606 (-),score=63.54 gnl/TRDRNA2_/TRDRNA2_157131_c0_seq2:13-1788(-)
MSSEQPLHEVQAYFGEHVAFYFAWLGFQVYMLMPLALLGLLIQTYVFVERDGALPQVWEGTLVVRSTSCALVVGWAIVYLCIWRRQEKLHCVEWVRLQEGNRGGRDSNPNYRGTSQKDPVTGNWRKKMSRGRRRLGRVFSLVISVIFLGMSGGAVMLILALQEALTDDGYTKQTAVMIISVLNAVQIKFFDFTWRGVALWLVEVENYRTLEKKRDTLIWKMFIFRAINAFGSIMWASWGCLLRDLPEEACTSEEDLEAKLAGIFASYTGLSLLTDMVVPWAKHKLHMLLEDGFAPHSTPGEPRRRRSFIETQMLMYEYDMRQSIEDYTTVTLETGFVLFFFTVFPGVALLAVTSHMLQLRADAWKLCYTHRRPFPEEVSGVGAWNGVMELLVRLGIVNNVALVIFRFKLFDHRTRSERWLMLLALERATLLVMTFISHFIKGTPRLARIAKKRRAVVVDRLEKEYIRCPLCLRHEHPPMERGPERECLLPTQAKQQPTYELGAKVRMLSDQLVAPTLRSPVKMPEMSVSARLRSLSSHRGDGGTTSHQHRRRTRVAPQSSGMEVRSAAYQASGPPPVAQQRRWESAPTSSG